MGRIIPYIMENKKQFETTILLSFQTPPHLCYFLPHTQNSLPTPSPLPLSTRKLLEIPFLDDNPQYVKGSIIPELIINHHL